MKGQDFDMIGDNFVEGRGKRRKITRMSNKKIKNSILFPRFKSKKIKY